MYWLNNRSVISMYNTAQFLHIRMKLTKSWVTKLSASHTSICCVPWIITDGSPLPVVADFRSTLILISSSNKTKFTISSACIITGSYEVKKKVINLQTHMNIWGSITWALDSNIIVVRAVSQRWRWWTVATVEEMCLPSTAVHIS